jgi:MoaA/NifB/PqqE/SkfB family radical SAM enzyme
MLNSFIKIDEINTINAELSNYCNAACPMCARFDHAQKLVKSITNNSHTTLDDIKYRVGDRVIGNLKLFYSCGNVGDGTMNPECFEIFEYVKSINTKTTLEINTNGGARTPEFYKSLAELGVRVIFSIDGLDDTNHLYRRNVKWDKVISNVEAFIKAGGRAKWDFLIFKHNQHQVEEAEMLSEKMGFQHFEKKTTTRWDDFDSDGNWLQRDKLSVDGYDLEKPTDEIKKYAHIKDQKQRETKVTRIECESYNKGNIEILLHANGNVSPCCHLGDLLIHESKNIINDYRSVNIRHTPLEQILEGHYFNEIWKGINGQAQQYKLTTCESVCGVCHE